MFYYAYVCRYFINLLNNFKMNMRIGPFFLLLTGWKLPLDLWLLGDGVGYMVIPLKTIPAAGLGCPALDRTRTMLFQIPLRINASSIKTRGTFLGDACISPQMRIGGGQGHRCIKTKREVFF